MRLEDVERLEKLRDEYVDSAAERKRCPCWPNAVDEEQSFKRYRNALVAQSDALLALAREALERRSRDAD